MPVYQRAVLKTHGNAFDISCPRAILMLPKNVISVNVFFFCLAHKSDAQLHRLISIKIEMGLDGDGGRGNKDAWKMSQLIERK